MPGDVGSSRVRSPVLRSGQHESSSPAAGGVFVLISQSFLPLLIAALIGFVVGWLLKHLGARRRIEALEGRLRKEEARGAVARRDLEVKRREHSALGGELDQAREDLARCREDSAESEAPDGPPPKDDLKKVEGIGPKIEGLLNAAGIDTWARLAAAPVAEVQAVLDEAGPRYRIHDPGTWGRQAGLAAQGRWDELEELQERLKGGREE